MTDRVILQREFSELYGLPKSIIKYATERAELHQCDVYLCVNTKSHSDKILKGIFEDRECNRLK